jgi:excinuclease ABC subunit A
LWGNTLQAAPFWVIGLAALTVSPAHGTIETVFEHMYGPTGSVFLWPYGSLAVDKIVIRGAREHNLKGVNLEIPRNRFIVFTGVSGSGKSSLAFDTLYAEGQRRYVESLSAYARQFLEQMEKPRVDYIGGLSPAIAIEQKSAAKNPRSTVGTVTEIYDYLRVLYARVGIPHCPHCGREIGSQTVQQMVDRVRSLPAGTRFQVLAPLVRERKGEYQELFENARAQGRRRGAQPGPADPPEQEGKAQHRGGCGPPGHPRGT